MLLLRYNHIALDVSLFFFFIFIYRYIGSTDEQQLARSYSFEIRRNNNLLPIVDNISPAVRYPTSQQMNRQENVIEKPLRSSSVNVLVNSAMIGSQISLPNRKVGSFFFSKDSLTWNMRGYFNEKKKFFFFLFANLLECFENIKFYQ